MSFIGNDSIGFIDACRLAWGLLLTAEGRAALKAGPEVGAMELTRRSIVILKKRKRLVEAAQESELLALMHLKREEPEAARLALQEAIEMDPDYVKPRLLLTLELLRQDQEGEALEQIPMLRDKLDDYTIVEASSAMTAPLINLAMTLQEKGHFPEALYMAEKAVDIHMALSSQPDPALVECLDSLAGNWALLGQSEQAEKLRAKARALREPSSDPTMQ